MYGKLFPSMFRGSMRGAGSHVFAVWTWILTNCDKEGFVEINTRILVDDIGESLARVIEAIEYLSKPDPNSRSEELSGRRVEKIGNYGYHVVNHNKYKNLKNEADKLEQNKAAQKRVRDKIERESARVSGESCESAYIDVDVDVGKKNKRVYTPDFEKFWTEYPLKISKKAAYVAWRLADPPLDTILEAIRNQKQWRVDCIRAGKFVPDWKWPQGWITGQRWLDVMPIVNVAPNLLKDQKCTHCGKQADAWGSNDLKQKWFFCKKCQPTLYEKWLISQGKTEALTSPEAAVG